VHRSRGLPLHVRLGHGRIVGVGEGERGGRRRRGAQVASRKHSPERILDALLAGRRRRPHCRVSVDEPRQAQRCARERHLGHGVRKVAERVARVVQADRAERVGKRRERRVAACHKGLG